MKKKPPEDGSEFAELSVETDEDGRTCVQSTFRHDQSLKRIRLSRKKLWAKGAPFPCLEYRVIENLEHLQSLDNPGDKTRRGVKILPPTSDDRLSDELREAENFAGRLISMAVRNRDFASLRRFEASLRDIVDEKSKPSEPSTIQKLRGCAEFLVLWLKRLPTKQEFRKQAEIERIVPPNMDGAQFSRLLRDAHVAKLLLTDHKAKGIRRDGES